MHIFRFLRSVAGLVVGTFVAVSVAILYIAFPSFGPPRFEIQSGTFLAGTVVGLMVALPMGFLGHAILYGLKWRNIVFYIIAGGLGGAGYAVAVAIDNTMRPQDFLTYGLMGSACAAIAWLVRRPDKDHTLI